MLESEESLRSIEYARRGRYWRKLREAEGLSMVQVAYSTGIPLKDIQLFEEERGTEDQVKTFPPLYADALGNPDSYLKFVKQFGI